MAYRLKLSGNFLIVNDDNDNELHRAPRSTVLHSFKNSSLKLYHNPIANEGRWSINGAEADFVDESGSAISGGAAAWLASNTGFNTALGGSGADLQTAHTTSLLFDRNRSSTFGDSDNRHTQSGALVYTYDFTGAVEGSVRTLEIISDGNTITIPNIANNTNTITNNSQTSLSVSDAVITPESGKNYYLIFWYSNGYVNVIINDATGITGDATPPTYTTAPVANLIIDTEADVFAQLNENGTIYGVIVADGASAPTPSEVKAGTGSGGSGQIDSGSIADSGNGGSLNFTGLTASTAYDVYVVAEDDSGNLMASVTKVDITTIGAITLPDFTGNSVTRIYSLFKSEQSTKNYPVMITDGSGNDYYIFFDSSGKISMDSKISTTTNPTNLDLTYYKDNILVGTTVYIKYIYCQITSHSVSTSGLHAKIWDSTLGLSVKDLETSIRFLGTDALEGTALSEFDSGNDFSVLVISSNETTDTSMSLINTRSAPDPGFFQLSNDRRTQKRIGVLRDSGGTFYYADDSAQDNTNNVKRLMITVDASGNMVSYKDAASKTTVSVSSQSGYTNDLCQMGGWNIGNFLDGHWQGCIVCNAAINSTQVSDIDTELNVML